MNELHGQTSQALMDGYEVPQSLQDERQDLEAAIASLRRKIKAMKVLVGFLANPLLCGAAWSDWAALPANGHAARD